MEQKQPCGKDGYWLHFGDHYCNKFLDDQAAFPQKTQVWLKDVRECLQTRAEELSRQISCERMQEEALDSHVGCYIDTGFCDLNLYERMKVYWYLRRTMMTSHAWKEAAAIHNLCFLRPVQPNRYTTQPSSKF
ncbi:hypothetical protein [Bdellovibrio reynosensis]|uniref:Uncharacterized protein n=1 Tax=Bdellovibrio reynosensis TaxID=2835041 RepID=A0ABY4CFV4_9BACT|nr:hypothetical protein [Bdellovibrio reynosensis]UOF02762.1 hypothetical protein MNR06_07335 [Bdellovibrio reynosensis]